MERTRQFGYALFFGTVVVSALLSSAFCVAAEFKKLKRDDIRFDGSLCRLPRSKAFEFGIAALICLSIGQLIGGCFGCGGFRLKSRWRQRKVAKPTVPCGLVVFSWVSFGIAVILISSATSMNRSQAYGEGWLHGECYIVKDGIYAASATLAFLAMLSTVSSAAIQLKEQNAEEQKKVHYSNKSNSNTLE